MLLTSSTPGAAAVGNVCNAPRSVSPPFPLEALRGKAQQYRYLEKDAATGLLTTSARLNIPTTPQKEGEHLLDYLDRLLAVKLLPRRPKARLRQMRNEIRRCVVVVVCCLCV